MLARRVAQIHGFAKIHWQMPSCKILGSPTPNDFIQPCCRFSCLDPGEGGFPPQQSHMKNTVVWRIGFFKMGFLLKLGILNNLEDWTSFFSNPRVTTLSQKLELVIEIAKMFHSSIDSRFRWRTNRYKKFTFPEFMGNAYFPR